MKKFYYIGVLFITLAACQPKPTEQTETTGEYGNPAAPGFNEAGSDATAIALADAVMEAMGGRKAWDETRAISWTFFGARKLFWEKTTGMVRVESTRDDLKIILNINTKEGRVFKNGEEFSDPDSIAHYVGRGHRIWINDAYWLVMPFKLKDSGVTLKHLGQDTTLDGTLADVLSLTFEEVGVTPQNAYKVWIGDQSKLVEQWAYYAEAGQEAANFVLPWTNYQVFGKIKLSGDRGERRLDDIKVWEELPQGVFDDFVGFSL